MFNATLRILEGNIEPSERHYKLAYEWLDFCARDIELDKYAEVQRTLRNLSDEEFSAINKALMEEMQAGVKLRGGTLRDRYIFRIINYIVKRGKAKRDELAAFLEVE